MIGMPTPRTSPSLLIRETWTGRPVGTGGGVVFGGVVLAVVAGRDEVGVLGGVVAAVVVVAALLALAVVLDLAVHAAKPVARAAPPSTRNDRLVVRLLMRPR
jgi:hypothetical protein